MSIIFFKIHITQVQCIKIHVLFQFFKWHLNIAKHEERHVEQQQKKNVSTFTNDSFGKINAKRAHLYIMFLLHIFLSMVAAVYSNLSYGKKKQ